MLPIGPEILPTFRCLCPGGSLFSQNSYSIDRLCHGHGGGSKGITLMPLVSLFYTLLGNQHSVISVALSQVAEPPLITKIAHKQIGEKI